MASEMGEIQQVDDAERVMDKRALVTFLYLLMRDEMVAGKVEQIVMDIEGRSPYTYSNPHLARYAQELADRLGVKGGGNG